MLLHLWLSDDGCNVSLLVNTEGRSVRPVVFPSHEFLQTPHSEGVLQAVVFVHKQVKGKLKFVDEFLVGGGMVDAHAEYRDVGGLEFSHSVAKAARLVGTAGGVVLWVEVQDDPFSAIVLEGVGLVVLVEG